MNRETAGSRDQVAVIDRLLRFALNVFQHLVADDNIETMGRQIRRQRGNIFSGKLGRSDIGQINFPSNSPQISS